MKKIKSTFFAIVVMMITAFSFTSCLGESGESNPSGYGYFTISGDATFGYTLYGDGGGIVSPTTSSVISLTGSNGFGSNKRAFLYYEYAEENVTQSSTTSEYTINNAAMTSGYYIPTSDVVYAYNGETEVNDSLFDIASLTSVWGYRGYITTVQTADYVYTNGAAVSPTFNLVYDTDDNTEPNVMNLTLCCNRHSAFNASTSGSSSFVNSFDISDMAYQVEGSDSVTVNISATGVSNKLSFKIARADFYPRGY